MDGQELYEELKAFLKYVGLNFRGMDQVQIVVPEKGKINFVYENKVTQLDLS